MRNDRCYVCKEEFPTSFRRKFQDGYICNECKSHPLLKQIIKRSCYECGFIFSESNPCIAINDYGSMCDDCILKGYIVNEKPSCSEPTPTKTKWFWFWPPSWFC